jgi:hypothetical protein
VERAFAIAVSDDMSATWASPRRRGGRLGVVIAMFALMWNGSIAAQSVSGTALKAAFLYNFAKFTEWPADILAPGQRLSLCVLGDNAVADALEQTIKGHTVESHEITVQVVTADGPIRSCHLLYAGGLDVKQSTHLIQLLKGAAVFTVSDGDKFAELGGVAQLILEKDRMRFAINVAAAQRARLQLSSKLLSLATIVKDQNYVQP